MENSTKTAIEITDEPPTGLRVPLNGIQLFEITNIDSNTREIQIILYSSRLIMLPSYHSDFDIYKITSELEPNESIVFGVKDKGHIEKIDCITNRFFEGTLDIYFSKKNPLSKGSSDRQFLAQLQIRTEPETDSYREYREWKDHRSDCYIYQDKDRMNKMITVEAISKDKYGEKLSEKLYKLTKIDKKHNLRMDKYSAMTIKKPERNPRITTVKTWTDAEEIGIIEKEMVAKLDLMELLGFKKEEEPPKPVEPEKPSKIQEEEPKISKIVEKSKKLEKSKSEPKNPPKNPPKSVKTEPENKIPPKPSPKPVSKPSIQTQKPKEEVKKIEEIVVEKKEEKKEETKGKKMRKKKKKKCVIS